VIQEFEGLFRGAGWNVLKVVWGREWDPLLAADADGVLVEKMNTTLDGEYQQLRVESGAFIREHFFGPDPRLRQLVAGMADDELKKLRRGGHDAGRSSPRTGPPWNTTGCRRWSWPRRSRAGRSDPTSKPATPPTRSRR